jgi:hypothetical protein
VWALASTTYLVFGRGILALRGRTGWDSPDMVALFEAVLTAE